MSSTFSRFSEHRTALALVAPAALLFLFLIALPLAYLGRISLLPSAPGAPLSGPLSVSSYRQLADPYLLGILWRTVRIALSATLGCLLLGYPAAISLARARGTWRSTQVLLVISPLFVSVVVRAYGWVLLLGNRGLINAALLRLGVVARPVQMLNTEAAVVVGLVEALLPFMILSIGAAVERIDPALEEAARGLGDSALGAFWRVTLPLSWPGALTGALLVFMVAMGAFATPALLGGSRVRVMVTEIYTQITAVFDWPLGAALSLLLLAVSLTLVLVVSQFGDADRLSGPA